MLEKVMNLHILLYCMAAIGAVGAIGMLAVHLTYRRMIKHTGDTPNLKEKWLVLWKTRDRLLHRMNQMVWYPALLSTCLLCTSLFLVTRFDMEHGLPLSYLYLGTAIPIALLLLRQALDVTYKDELLLGSLTDYVEKARVWVEDVSDTRKNDPVLQEEMVERITASIRQTAATGSHFSKMLTPEEEEIMREIIREFMN